MKLNILVPGDEIILLKDFKADLKNAGQNTSFISNNGKKEIVIKKGVKLKVDRVYIRQDAENFNSITFRSKNNKDLIDGRFYLPIKEVNELDVDIINNTKKRDVIKEYQDYNSFRGISDRLSKILEKRDVSSLLKFKTELNALNLLNKNISNIKTTLINKKDFFKELSDYNKNIMNKFLSILEERKISINKKDHIINIIDCELLKIDNDFYLDLNNLIEEKHKNILSLILLSEGIISLLKSLQKLDSQHHNIYPHFLVNAEYIFKDRYLDENKIDDILGHYEYTINKVYRGIKKEKGVLLDYKSISSLNMFQKDKDDIFSFVDIDNNHYSIDEIRKEMTKRKKMSK